MSRYIFINLQFPNLSFTLFFLLHNTMPYGNFQKIYTPSTRFHRYSSEILLKLWKFPRKKGKIPLVHRISISHEGCLRVKDALPALMICAG